MKYKYLLFDADGTLFDYDSAESYALEATLTEFGEECSAARRLAYRRINEALFADFEKGLLTSAELRINRFERLFVESGLELDPEAFSLSYLSRLAESSALLPGALEVIRELHSDFSLYLVTNGIGDVQRRRIDASEIRPYFKDILISDEIGFAKPSRKFFEAAFEMIGRPPKSDVLIIGDGLSSDMAGGIDYGIDACWFNPDRIPNGKNLEVTYEIDRLDRLMDIVGCEPEKNH